MQIIKGKTNWIFLLIVILVAILAVEGILFYLKQFDKEIIVSNLIYDRTSNWMIYKDKDYGFEFKYPEKFGAKVWRPYFWPPKATVVFFNENPVEKGCPDFPLGIQGATKNEVKVNDINFEFYKGSEGAAGSIYTSYCYVTEKDNNYYVLSFVIRSTSGCGYNCGPYCDTQYESECENLNIYKDIEKPIKDIVSTFRFVE